MAYDASLISILSKIIPRSPAFDRPDTNEVGLAVSAAMMAGVESGDSGILADRVARDIT
jgi:hypothetical protein